MYTRNTNVQLSVESGKDKALVINPTPSDLAIAVKLVQAAPYTVVDYWQYYFKNTLVWQEVVPLAQFHLQNNIIVKNYNLNKISTLPKQK